MRFTRRKKEFQINWLFFLCFFVPFRGNFFQRFRDRFLDKLKMKKWFLLLLIVPVVLVGAWFAVRYIQGEREDAQHFEQEETDLVITNLANAKIKLFKAGNKLQDATELKDFNGERIWLARGNYFLKVDSQDQTTFYPVPITGYRTGPDNDGSFAVTIRHLSNETPPKLLPDISSFVFIPSGNFLLGERKNPREPHYVWLPAFFISPFEVTNAEFKEFLNDPKGFGDDSNWTEAGKKWKASNTSKATATLKTTDAEYKRFGQPTQPVTWVTWFEAQAFCKWLTKKFGQGKWIFSLPSEAEWEKAARGPDSFDYGLGNFLSDKEVKLYNWKKNPDAPVTVIDIADSKANYTPNRYGLYHVSGNVVEWTSSISRPFNRDNPYKDEERNREDSVEVRIVRGGSWYSASIALLYIPYRDNFQPEISHHDLGFRIVVRLLP
jgi:formylglycine-generating enzyme required for sulfatase activity